MKRTIALVLLGSLAVLPAAALYQANGVIHVIDRVVLPK